MAGKVPSNYHGVVFAEVVGLKETCSALNDIAEKFPVTFKKALGAEVVNLKRSIAAALRNYKIAKAVPVPNLIEARAWSGYSLARKSNITKMLHGNKHESHLAKPGSISIESVPNGFRVGHFGGLAKYAVKWQDGVPRHLSNPKVRDWMYDVLGPKMGIHDKDALYAAIAPVSPPRPYIQVLADKCGRDFVPGLVRCFQKIASGAFKKAGCKKAKN